MKQTLRIIESQTVAQILQEATYSWSIDPTDKSWFITVRGELWSDMSHRIILKRKFPQEWDNLKQRGSDDIEIEDLFTKRLIRQGAVKIGELDEFYAVIYTLDNRTRDMIQGFAKSILQVRQDVGDMIMCIDKVHDNEIIKCTIYKAAHDSLFK